MKVAVSHPGKIGDALYALSVACNNFYDRAEIDFYTSDYCRPLRNFALYQPNVANFIVPDNYTIERMDMGCQPWQMPIDESQYDAVYQMGFQEVPNCSIPDYIAKTAGLVSAPVYWKAPEIDHSLQYVVLAPRGVSGFHEAFKRFTEVCPIDVMIVGGKGDYAGYGYDATGADFLYTASLMKYASGFIGLMSSQLVLANGFDMPKVIPHDGKSWDMRHVVNSSRHHYLVDPTGEQICERIFG